MSDPRNVAHDKKVSQAKKQHGENEHAENTATAQPGRKPATKEKHGSASVVTSPDAAAHEAVVPDETATSKPDAALEGSLAVLAKFKDLEFHSRANLERLAELALTVEDELKQKALAVPLSEVYSAQNAVQTKLIALIEAYKTECDRMQH